LQKADDAQLNTNKRFHRPEVDFFKPWMMCTIGSFG
jgi:hypothetical protein